MIMNFNTPLKLETTTVDASTVAQTFSPNIGYLGFQSFGINAVTANIDNNIIPSNIKSGIEILGITGTVGSDLQDRTIDASVNTLTYYAEGTYLGLNSVTIPGVTANIDNNISSENIKFGVNILGIDGTYVADATWYGAEKTVKVAKNNSVHIGECIDLSDNATTTLFNYYEVYTGLNSHSSDSYNETNNNTTLSDFSDSTLYISYKSKGGVLVGSIYTKYSNYLENTGLSNNCEITFASSINSLQNANIKDGTNNFTIYANSSQLIIQRVYLNNGLLTAGEASVLATLSGIQYIDACYIEGTSPNRYLVTYTTSSNCYGQIVTINGTTVTYTTPLSIKPFTSTQTYSDIQCKYLKTTTGVHTLGVIIKYTSSKLAYVKLLDTSGVLSAPTKVTLTTSSGDTYAYGYKFFKLSNSKILLIYGAKSVTTTPKYYVFNSETGIVVTSPVVINSLSIGQYLDAIELPVIYPKHKNILITYGDVSVNKIYTTILNLEAFDTSYDNIISYTVKDIVIINAFTSTCINPKFFINDNTVYLAHNYPSNDYLNIMELSLSHNLYAENYVNTIKGVSENLASQGSSVKIITPNILINYNLFKINKDITGSLYNNLSTINLTAESSHYINEDLYISTPDTSLSVNVDYTFSRTNENITLYFTEPLKQDIFITAAADKYYSLLYNNSDKIDLTYYIGSTLNPSVLFYNDSINITIYTDVTGESFQATPTINGNSMIATTYNGYSGYKYIGYITTGNVNIVTCLSEQGCSICDVCDACNTCETCDACDSCDVCDNCDSECGACESGCQDCQACEHECQVCDACDTCQEACQLTCQDQCEFCQIGCEICESGDACESCDTYYEPSCGQVTN